MEIKRFLENAHMAHKYDRLTEKMQNGNAQALEARKLWIQREIVARKIENDFFHCLPPTALEFLYGLNVLGATTKRWISKILTF